MCEICDEFNLRSAALDPEGHDVSIEVRGDGAVIFGMSDVYVTTMTFSDGVLRLAVPPEILSELAKEALRTSILNALMGPIMEVTDADLDKLQTLLDED